MTAASATVVEFLGLPGSGKSTLSHRLAQQLTARGVRVSQTSYDLAHGGGPGRRRCHKALRVGLELARHPVAAWRSLRAIAATHQRDLRTRGKLLFNWLLVVNLARHARRRPGVHLFDQGVLQAIWSIALEDRSDEALDLLAFCATHDALPSVAVVVAASIDVVRQRLDGRRSHASRVERRPAAEALLQRGEHLVRVLRDAAARTGNVRIVDLANETSDPERAAAAIADRIVAHGNGDVSRCVPVA